MSRTGRKSTRGNLASMESYSTRSSDPSHDGYTADEIVRKGEGTFKRIKEECIKAHRTMSLMRDICD